MSQLVFDESMATRLEEVYRTRDVMRRRALVREALAAAPGERILDVGCGPGFYAAELLEQVGPNGAVTGVDGSAQMLAFASRRCDGHSNVTFHEADATALPVEGGVFDAALTVQVLEYVEDIPAALAELHRALRPGGRLVVWDVDWATLSLHSNDAARTARMLRAWDEHLAHPSLPRTLGPLMRAAGFDDVRLEGHAFTGTEFTPDAYLVAILPLMREYVVGREGIDEDEAKDWEAELRGLGERGEFYFACIQACFSAIREG
jgi:arsenite methyltransferase